ARQSHGLDARELLCRQIGILERHDPETEKAAGRLLAHVPDDLVGIAAEVTSILGCEPVRAELGHRRDHLRTDALVLHVAEATVDVPVAVVDGAIVLARDHHVGTAGLEVIHGRPRPGARPVARSREVLWDDVRMHVDDHAKAPCRGTGFVALLTNRRPLGAPLRARAQPAKSIQGGRLRKGGEAPLRVYLSHCRRAFRKSSIWNGLEITKSTPRCTASAGCNKSRQPVMSPTGVAGRRSFTAWATSHPPSPGMARAGRTTSQTSASSLRTA